MGRTPCCSKMGLNRGPWTPEEDQLLSNYIKQHGEGGWRTLPKKAGLLRCGKSCRLRWMNYLRPDVKRGQILPDEEDLILRLHRLLGNRWSLIAGRIPGRTDNEIKNYWNTHLSRKLISQGIDPRTHKPLAESELDNHAPHDSNNKEESGNKPSPASDFQEKCSETGIVADNIEAYKLVEDHHSPQLIKDSEIPETSVTGSLHAYNDSNTSNTIQPPAFQDAACKQPSSSAVNIIPYCNVPSDLGLQEHDASVFLRRNSITNSYFMAPPTMDSGLQKIPSFLGSVTENGPYQGFQMNIEQSAIQQRQVTEESRMDVIPMTAGATVEDYNSDIFSYFLESFMGEDHLHDEANKHGATSVSENWQQFSQTESSSRLGYNVQSMMLTPSQDPSNFFQRL